jgi:hypothetical protein
MRPRDDLCRGGADRGWLLLQRLVGLAGLGPSPDAKDIEIAVLRHQLAVVRPPTCG